MPILALDVGSSSVRAMLYENLLNAVQHIPDAVMQKKYEFDTYGSRVTFDPQSLQELLEETIDEILQHPAAKSVEAVGMATFAGNLNLLSFAFRKGKGLRYDIMAGHLTYADKGAVKAVEILKTEIDEASNLQRTGAMIHSAYWTAQLKYLGSKYLDSGPVDRDRLPRDFSWLLYEAWFSPKNWERDLPISYSMASWSGMLNREKLEWDEEWLKVLGLSRNLFPPLADFTQAQIGLNEYYAKQWPALANVPFYLAVGDGAAAQVGSGAVEAGTAALTIGTTAAIRKVSTEALPRVPSGCWSYRIDKDHHLTGGALSEGGNIFAWAKETFNLEAVDIEAELSQREPDSHGLTVLPLLNGERSPNWRGDATGTIHGLRLSTSPMDIVHALLEAVALRLAYIANQLELAEGTRIMAAGGALQASPAWAQIIANALGRDIYVMDEPEITSLGVAQLVHSALKGEKITGAKPKIAKIYKPNSNHFVRFNEAQARQNELYKRLYS
jgi:gluconokinase